MINKLHIGCGRVFLPRDHGWINCDLFSSTRADIYSDMCSLPFHKESFDLIYASHVLEHCHRFTVLATLAHWHSLLRTTGVLRLAVPDFRAVALRYQETQDLKELMGLLYGRQDHPKNVHTVAFDETTLSESLLKVGFRHVKPWDWRTTEHAQYDDFSQCYLPHLDKEQGTQMSLNLEAWK